MSPFKKADLILKKKHTKSRPFILKKDLKHPKNNLVTLTDLNNKSKDVFSSLSALKHWSSYSGSQVIIVCILELNNLVSKFKI